MAFARRLAILPGGLGGLGSSIGKRLRAEGAKLAILYAPFEADRRDELLHAGYHDSPKATTATDIRTYACDITSPASVQEAFTSLTKEMISPDLPPNERAVPSILINTAGYVSLSDMHLTPPEETLKHLTTNVYGPMLCAQAFANLYFDYTKTQAAKSSGNEAIVPGRIVNLASKAAHVALHQHGAYCASKAAVLGLTRCMASEWGPRGITANTVSPTVAWTELGRKAWGAERVKEELFSKIPVGRAALPEEVAEAVAFLCRDSSGMINGTDIKVDGGYTIR
ncbi:dehydrogenase with different specificitie [Aspergillus unguis]